MSVPMGGDRLPELSELSLHELSDYDADAGFERFLEISAGVPVDAPTPELPRTSAAPLGVWTRIALWGPSLLVMGVGLGLGLRQPESPPPSAPAPLEAELSATEPVREASVVGLVESARNAAPPDKTPPATDPTAEPSATAPPNAPTARAPRTERAADDSADAHEPETQTPGTLEAELQLAARMRRVLAQDPAEALRLARKGQSRFPEGIFVKERLEHEVLALIRLERSDEASRLAARFLRRYPTGPQSDRVRRALGR